LWASSSAIGPLEASDLPTADPPIGLEQFVLDNSPTDASSLDGFDEIFTETVALVDSLEIGLISLNPTLDETFAEADTLDAGPLADDITGFTSSLSLP